MRRQWACVLVLLAATALAYRPGLAGPFLFDDEPNITANRLLNVESLTAGAVRDAAYSANFTYPHRGIARLSFGLNYYFAGGRYDAWAFKATNLAIHLVNGLLVFLLARALLGMRERTLGGEERGWSDWAAVVAAGLWLLHPLELTSVLYVVQRMTSLAGLFVFSGLLGWAHGRRLLGEGRSGAGVGWMLAGVAWGAGVGFLSKENAVLMPLLALVAEFTVATRAGLGAGRRRMLWGFYAVVVGLPVLAGLVTVAVAPGVLLDGYLNRDFTLAERLWTEPRVLFFYLSLWAFPYLRRFGLYHDDLVLSTGWLEPWTTLVSVVGWVALFAAALWFGLRRRQVWALGLLWFLAGHGLESTALSLELVHERRNYVPGFGVALAGGYYLVSLGRFWPGLARARVWLVVAVFAVVGLTTGVRAGIWSERSTLAEFMVRNHPRSARSLLELGAAGTASQAANRRIYAAYRDSVTFDSGAVAPLVHMARIVANRIGFLRQQGRGGGAASEVVDLRSELGDDVPTLVGQLRLVDAEIRARLARAAVPPDTANALAYMSSCTIEGQLACRDLADAAVDWHRIALANGRARPYTRAEIGFSLARMLFFRGQVEEAVAYMRSARQHGKDDLGLWIEEADLYLRLRRWSALEELLADLDAAGNRSVFRDRVIAAVERDYRAARAAGEREK